MKLAGTEITASAAARLAVRLEQAGELGLAHRVGIAVDTGHDFGLNKQDRTTVLQVLADRPGEMAEIRKALR